MSYSAGLTAPDLFKGIAAMSGRLLEEVKHEIASPEELQHLRVFISHGKEDRMLNIEYARSCAAYLKSLGIQPTYKDCAEGHGINKEMLADLIHWLKQSILIPPAKLACKAVDLSPIGYLNMELTLSSRSIS